MLFAERDADRFGQTAWHYESGLPRLGTHSRYHERPRPLITDHISPMSY